MQKEKVDIDNEEGAQISNVAKKTLAQRLWSPNKLFMTIILFFFIVMFVLCYWYDKNTGTGFTGNYNFI